MRQDLQDPQGLQGRLAVPAAQTDVATPRRKKMLYPTVHDDLRYMRRVNPIRQAGHVAQRSQIDHAAWVGNRVFPRHHYWCGDERCERQTGIHFDRPRVYRLSMLSTARVTMALTPRASWTLPAQMVMNSDDFFTPTSKVTASSTR